MAKLPPIPDELRKRAKATFAAAWDEGCPVAGPPHDKAAEVCIRRWRSFGRRGVDGPDRWQKIHDAALGLIAAIEAKQEIVGPLIVDYEHLAGRVLHALEMSVRPPYS